jgi:hypothetical protein
MMKFLILACTGALFLATGCLAADAPGQTVWLFDNLHTIGGLPVQVEGHPRIVETPAGKAVQFNGVDDALFIDKHPLAGAKTFTFEAIIRPDGGAFAQRWFHLAEIDPATGKDSNARFLFELRVPPGSKQWYLDAFVNGPGYKQTLAFPEKLYPIGHWYAVAQTYDGKTYRSYVDGVLQGEADIAFVPQGPGHASIGVRMNRVNYFHGAILEARFTPRALTPDEFLKAPH